MGYSMRREMLEHGHERFVISWGDSDRYSVSMGRGKGATGIHILDKRFFLSLGYIYPDADEFIAEALSIFIRERKEKKIADAAEWERRVAERIPVVGSPANEEINGLLDEGKAIQFCWLSGGWEIKTFAESIGVECDCWYTERNGDSIAMLVPCGTPKEKLPLTAMEYMAFNWYFEGTAQKCAGTA